MIACYCRVSCHRQKNDSQKAEIERWLKNNEISLSSVQWFEDKDSGKSMKRPAFDRMQQAIFKGTIKTSGCLEAGPDFSSSTRRC